MNSAALPSVVITGIGMVTPLGTGVAAVLRRIRNGDSVAEPPTEFDATVFACPVCAQVASFEPQSWVTESKMARLMNRDAQFAVAAARLALKDAGVKAGVSHRPDEIALFGASGMAGLPLREVVPLIRVSAGRDGGFDLARFGAAGLKAVSPILSFKILSNMPLCFVSINENIQGPNAIYTPWEGEGAQTVEAGIKALQYGDARCALVGGCDVKTHELAFASLQQQGLFDGWQAGRRGVVPAEGAAFMVLETESGASARDARAYARLSGFSLAPCPRPADLARTRAKILRNLDLRNAEAVVSSANGDEKSEGEELSLLESAGISAPAIRPKKHLGDLFAAAALVQVALGAGLVNAGAERVLANCFGHGSTQAAFLLEQPEMRSQEAER